MHDIDIRIAIREKILADYYADSNSRVVEEMGIFQGVSRIDIAVIGDSLYGYEIKSENDTLYRLNHQLQYYRQVFDYLTFVVSVKHENSIKSVLPEWCGLIVVSEQAQPDSLLLTHKIKPERNPEINSLAIAQLLWKDELLCILNNIGIKKGLSNKSKRYLWQIAADNFSIKELSELVRQFLKKRTEWRTGK